LCSLHTAASINVGVNLGHRFSI